MGGSQWQNDYYQARQQQRVATNTPIFQHDSDVRSGKVQSALHEALDPKLFKNGVRESRDSANHPNSVPIIFVFDITGSMAEVPLIVQGQLGHLMNDILKNGIVADPQILFGAIGDANTGGVDNPTEKAPVQIGQFESGIEMDDDITRIYLEGNGGGQEKESYELAFYFAARKTATDAWDKRQRKGYFFMTGDEHAYPSATRANVKRLFGDAVEADIPLETLIREAKERYHCFFLLPQETSYTRDPHQRNVLRRYWGGLIGDENVLDMLDASNVCEVIINKIGELEGTLLPKVAPTQTIPASPAPAPLDPTAQAVSAAKAAGKRTARI